MRQQVRVSLLALLVVGATSTANASFFCPYQIHYGVKGGRVQVCMVENIPARNGDLVIHAEGSIFAGEIDIKNCRVSFGGQTFNSGGVSMGFMKSGDIKTYIIVPQMSESLRNAFKGNPPPTIFCD